MATKGENGPGGAGAFGRRLLLAVDAKGYGGVDTSTQQQFQEAITRTVKEAADAAGLKRAKWKTQEGGDSLFAVLPKEVSEPDLVDAFMRTLEAGLRSFNSGRAPQARLRLRAAVHFGETSRGPNGFVGSAPVEIGRIRDCAALRAALDQMPDACLAVGLSATVFHDVVKGKPYTTVGESEFLEVPVREKEYRGAAWIWLPGGDVRELGLRDAVREDERRATNVLRGIVDVDEIEDAYAAGIRTDHRTGTFEGTTKVRRVGPGATVIGVEQTTAGDDK
ncbi:hypothetical protein ACFWOL_26575 [Streptomyces sp. NPDC058442]|uniref:hypothetical protein n=1 Tax=Streptomyces sp. NPDC058442 TaxID=3346503 RepID=UPI0036575CBB